MRIDDLMVYFDRLIHAENAGYKCSKEIGECIEAIRKELNLGTDVSAIAQTLAKQTYLAGDRNA